MSFVILPALKNSNVNNESEDVYVNTSNISLIRPAPGRMTDRSALYLGLENTLTVLLPPAKVIELIKDAEPQFSAMALGSTLADSDAAI